MTSPWSMNDRSVEENKKNATAFYKMAYEGNPHDAVEKFVGDTYIQLPPHAVLMSS